MKAGGKTSKALHQGFIAGGKNLANSVRLLPYSDVSYTPVVQLLENYLASRQGTVSSLTHLHS